MKRIHGAGGGGGSQSKSKEAPKPKIKQDQSRLKSISFAKLQFLLCEGEIEGPAFGNSKAGLEKSVFLDDTAIRSSSGAVSLQPEDLVFSWGRASGQQSGVPDYNRTSQVESVDTVCADGAPVDKAVTGSVAGGRYYATVLLTWQALYQSVLNGKKVPGNTGDVRAYRVRYKVSYTDSVGTVRTIVGGNDSLKGKFSSTFQRSHRFELQGVGPTWTVTVERLTRDDDEEDNVTNDGDTDTQSTFSFSSVTLSLDQKFNYAHTSMLSLGVRADRYAAIPGVSVELKGLKIEVPSNMDANGDFIGPWDGTFKRAWTDSPPWVLRDLILNDRYGVGQYVTADAVDKWSLYEIGLYCREQVPAADGGTEPRFTCNLLLQSGAEAWNVLQQVSSIFRGLVYYASSLAIAAQDREKDPVFTFSEANTIEQVSDDGKVSAGNFVYSGTARRAIHTVALVSWDDPANNYETRIEYVTNDETFEAYGYRPLDLRLLGVTSRGQALRAANWALLSERLLQDTISFSTNEIGMAVRPGDIVTIADTTKAALRIGGRIVEVNGLDITLDQEPQNPPGGWTGATISWMYNDADNEPQLQVANVVSHVDNLITIDADGGNPPVATFPWMIEFPSRTAQPFRILTVSEEGDGVYAITALRYRSDIYDAVDFDSPLQEDENYLFKPVNPTAPLNLKAQVIWDNGQAKLFVTWDPPANAATLFEYDLTVESYRVQWQSGTVEEDGTITWSDAWRELPRQTDDLEYIPLEALTITDKFRVRIAAASRLDVQSDWSDIVVADDIWVWFPMPDISQPLNTGDSRLQFRNQSSGAQLFTWNFGGLAVPPYVNGIRLEVMPNRPLTAREAEGIRDPDGDGRYIYGDFPVEEYAVAIFHADTNWDCRVSFLTSVGGLFGETYATATVDRLDLVPPPPDLFTVVTTTVNKSIAPLRRFSWSLPTSEIQDDNGGTPGTTTIVTENWPLGKVTDIVQFQVRYKAGFENIWELGVPLFADGVPGDQRFFETDLFDSGQWTVMIRSIDRTGWVSDNQASIVIGLGDPIPTNVVETFDAATDGWPGQLDNMQINGSTIEQIDPTQDGFYFYPFTVTANDAGILINTESTGTYQWFLRRIGEDADGLMYPDPQTDPMYPDPQTDYMYLDTNNQLGQEFHPYAPFEILEAGDYEIAARIRSIDGVTPTVVSTTFLELDYPDIRQSMEDISVPASDQRVVFPEPFPHAVKAVNVTLQDPAGTVSLPATAYIRGKDVNGFDIRLLDSAGSIVSGLVDVVAVGY